ncbi:hypothetical protein SS05631_b59830 (plasmid) [Sinorhizobium sp. CCBAU 05631]|nr:hypothetical protein SS05631_b59830 [Sinorhizobium sp. CCBAU 05631]
MRWPLRIRVSVASNRRASKKANKVDPANVAGTMMLALGKDGEFGSSAADTIRALGFSDSASRSNKMRRTSSSIMLRTPAICESASII